jgi:hypothetical protein
VNKKIANKKRLTYKNIWVVDIICLHIGSTRCGDYNGINLAETGSLKGFYVGFAVISQHVTD